MCISSLGFNAKMGDGYDIIALCQMKYIIHNLSASSGRIEIIEPLRDGGLHI